MCVVSTDDEIGGVFHYSRLWDFWSFLEHASVWFSSVKYVRGSASRVATAGLPGARGLRTWEQPCTPVSFSGCSKLACAEQRAGPHRLVPVAVRYPDVPPLVSRTPVTNTKVSVLEGSGAQSFQREPRTSHLKQVECKLVPRASRRTLAMVWGQ